MVGSSSSSSGGPTARPRAGASAAALVSSPTLGSASVYGALRCRARVRLAMVSALGSTAARAVKRTRLRGGARPLDCSPCPSSSSSS
ncbi:uncharacterized protein PITG_22872 [Phytophthora infestans T30-4]|uniref:Uncharacterized protein n=1 Tax=Phytophthora infestans (strain T30-4) TaxID=403677 RepID=D0NDN4_PHYIT|nr:uncharacterized protein PITG_22872 [Phytophthora infestans T30-4]EEY56191.1 conserved hypothetical protein [Phytophthora infestans T30-4]|eukprot:XP_002903021.1 conserved hypothetical protein [Phytophthora infestans T30-4]